VYNGATLANKVCYADFQPLSFFVAAHRQDSITVSDQPHTLQVDMVTLTTVCKTISFHSMLEIFLPHPLTNELLLYYVRQISRWRGGRPYSFLALWAEELRIIDL